MPTFLHIEKGEKMNRRVSSRIMLTLLLISALTMISPRFAAAVVDDVAVTNVITFKTVSNANVSYTLTPFDVVYQNYSVSINATVKNQGDQTEDFDVTAKYDSNIIGTVHVTGLGIGESKNVTFPWDTHGVARGSYTINVTAVLAGDVTPVNNTKTYGPVKVTWLGDQDGNFTLNEDDFWYFCAYFITYHTLGKGYRDRLILYDFDENCEINALDLWKFCDAWINYYEST
jgi:hypothetical protein